MESVMVLDELTTAAEVWERARQVRMRRRAQYRRRAVPVVVECPPEPPPPVEIPKPVVLTDAVVALAKITIPQRPEYIVMRVVAARYGVRPDALRSVMRHQPLVSYRQRAIWVVRMLFGKARSLPRIARAFGNRDHTTIIHAVRSVEAKRALDPELRADLDDLLEECRAAMGLTDGERQP